MKRTRLAAGVLLTTAALLAATAPGSAQLSGTENGEWRYLGGDAGHTRSSTLNQINASNFSTLKVAWTFRGDNFGPGLEFTARVDAALCRRRALHRHRAAPPGRGDRRRHGRDEVDVSRAGDEPLLPLAAHRLRQGGRLREGRGPRGDLHLDARLLPLGAGRQDRPAARELGRSAGAAQRLSRRAASST